MFRVFQIQANKYELVEKFTMISKYDEEGMHAITDYSFHHANIEYKTDDS